jgi:hypothetical protein
MKTRELSHLAQTATDPTVGFEYIVQQALILPTLWELNQFYLNSDRNTMKIQKISKSYMRLRKLSHLTQIAIGFKTVGFENMM